MMEPGNHRSQFPLMTHREEGTTNPNLPPYNDVSSWLVTDHFLMDISAVLLCLFKVVLHCHYYISFLGFQLSKGGFFLPGELE